MHKFSPPSPSVHYITTLALPISIIACYTTPEREKVNLVNIEMRKSCGVFFLLLLLVFASQVVVQTEGRVCESQSHHFKGPCSGDHNCALICRNEGFSGGNCRGFRRRCFCTKIC